MGLYSIILAAGEGKRMKSNIAKPLQQAAGKALVEWVLDTAEETGSDENIVVIGHKAEDVKAYLGDRAKYAYQYEQLGTGHAVMQGIESIKDVDGTVMVLYGDSPLIEAETLKRVREDHSKKMRAATVITAIADEPYGYGRIVRENGEIVRIVEQKDASEDEQKITEVNSGMYFFDIQKLKEYIKKIHLCGTRNSYSKTDPDATFMRMKEDAMMNGQLKPAYNLQHGVDSEYITWIDISAKPTDTGTLIPFLKDMEKYLSFRYQEIVADAGYESEENYLFLEKNGQSSFIKPMNYEISKTRKYKKDIGKMENMEYDPEKDSYRCQNRKMLTVQYQRKQKTATGYLRTVTVYQCHECKGCPFKEKCIKGNNCKTPMEKREKRLYVSKVMKQKREENVKRIISEYGNQLRMNRSIQAEGSFANVKEDMNFRRYLYRGKENVTAQSVILAIGYNINKLHHKIQNGRTGQHLFALKK